MKSTFIQDMLGVSMGQLLRDLLKGELKEGASAVAERIRGLIKENPRALLLYVLLALEPADAAKLWERHREAVNENTWVSAVGQALPKKPDGTVDMETAKKVFSQLAEMDKEQFEQTIELLKHDPVAQHVHYYLKLSRDFADSIMVSMAKTTGTVIHFTKETAVPWLAENDRAVIQQKYPGTFSLIQKIETRIEKQPQRVKKTTDKSSKFSRLAAKIFR